MTTTTPPALPADLDAGFRRLRLGAMRRLSPELLVTAKTQRWAPEEFLRTLIDAEIASRDASNARERLRQAAFPVTKTLEEFNVATSSVKAATFDYLASLEWVRAKENLCLVGPAGTGKSHLLVALGHHGVESGLRVRYFTAAELVETLYRGMADNSVGRVIESILRRRPHPDRRDRIRPARPHRRPAVLPPRRRRLRATLPRHRLALALRGLGPLPARAHHRRQPPRPPPPPRRRRGHRGGVVPHARSPFEGGTPRTQEGLITPEGWGLLLATSGDYDLAIDTTRHAAASARSFNGIEMNDEAVSLTRTRFDIFGLTGVVRQMDAEKLAFPDSSFDFIWSWGVIQHKNANTPQILREMKRVMRRGGRVVVMVYQRSFWW